MALQYFLWHPESFGAKMRSIDSAPTFLVALAPQHKGLIVIVVPVDGISGILEANWCLVAAIHKMMFFRVSQRALPGPQQLPILWSHLFLIQLQSQTQT